MHVFFLVFSSVLFLSLSFFVVVVVGVGVVATFGVVYS
jgi:hypothetical protein